ncbi:MAG TPA: class I SAM-dependent methyltransferase [Phycisphaerales bacterium]|nr:class I SAM-dependent methyltransferase [Phycisphaerales bacterium]HMP36831.1 class I SAM-dependent methyltransferase [Phycisphaerales bacterium]
MAGSKTHAAAPRTRRSRRGATHRTAATSDRHELYELSVQNPEAEVEFIERIGRKLLGRAPQLLREDFCGTFHLCGEWVRRRKSHRAIGVDLDPSVLEWGLGRAGARMKPEQLRRIELHCDDVLNVRCEPVDVLTAFNFSYFLFRERETLATYFRRCRKALVPGGILFCDAYGGSDSFREIEEERSLDGFVYVWDQHHYNPITGEAVNHIHFRFPDGTELRRAFSYRWRLWTLPEIRELISEAGFEDVTVYWEGSDRKGGGNGVFTPSTRGEACEGWIAYIVARNPKATTGRKGTSKRAGSAKRA